MVVAKDKYESESYDYKDQVEKFELGLPVGAGYRINDQISAGLRMTYGITNLDNTTGGSSDHNFLLVANVRYNLSWSPK